MELLGDAKVRHDALHAPHGEGQIELEVVDKLSGAIGVGSEV